MSHARKESMALLEERLGLKIAARLTDASDALPHDISERLRHARMQAVARRKQTRSAVAEEVLLADHNSLALGGRGPQSRWWLRMGMVLPVLALFIGLVAIDSAMDDNAAREIAKVDTALLVDDLPPAAYADPGFLQFLKMSRDTPR